MFALAGPSIGVGDGRTLDVACFVLRAFCDCAEGRWRNPISVKGRARLRLNPQPSFWGKRQRSGFKCAAARSRKLWSEWFAKRLGSVENGSLGPVCDREFP